MWRDDAYLLDMLLAARKVQSFTIGITQEQFERDEILQHAVLRMIQIIGEAANKISPTLREAHPEIPWSQIIGMRHRLVHDYLHIDLSRVWQVIERDIPALIPMIAPLVPPDEPSVTPR
jgi:uncharacterized protein with HEPN domain